ncbi:MAG TPA: hypothetical protein VG297_21805, partial [Bryobacteraceae bacterium]|nr:hypothetical protein [Bryobacteraceae bacterium]
MENNAIVKGSAATASIILYFLLLTHRGLNASFDGDDLTNISFLHGYGRTSLGAILAAALSIFTPEYRPIGGLYYRILFAVFGLHPAPFRIAFFALLIANLIAAIVWCRSLSNSMMTTVTAGLFFSFHPALAALYYSTGTIYDVLCVLFTLLLLIHYTRIRQARRFVAGNSLIVVLAFYGAALGSKEMAATVPAVLVLYELIFHPHIRDLNLRLRPVALMTAMTVIEVAIKLLLPNQMNINPWYAPHYNAVFVGNSYMHYYRLFFLNDNLTPGTLLGVLVIGLLTAVVSRSRIMLFGMLFANLTLIPVCVILPRGGFVWYMPLLGYALYGGAAVSLFVEKITGNLLPALLAAPVKAVVFISLLVGSYIFYSRYARNLGELFLPEQRQLSAMLVAAKRVAPMLPHGSRVLIESDPHREVWWVPLFLIRLAYRDPSIWVERASHLGDNYNPADIGIYNIRMRWDGSRYQVISQPQASQPPVVFDVTPDVPDVFGAVRRGQTARIHL